MPKINLLNLTPTEATAALETYFRERGEPLYRARQVARRLWQSPVRSFADITDVPVAIRNALEQAFELPGLSVLTEQLSSDGTRKFLFRLADGESIETVSIPDAGRLTLCIS
ncbi:MAG: 23S rRNA (adenine(2503)-C(2))-methyltransferase RlmN, partial [Gemmatimonadaceae bacterium]